MPCVHQAFLTVWRRCSNRASAARREVFPGGGDNPLCPPLYSAVHMLVHELSAVDCVEVLKRTDLGRLGCAHDNQPYIVPIHFSFDPIGTCLYAFSTVGQKIEWMRENPKVCIEVEDIADRDHWTTVLAFGRYEEMDDSPVDKEARASAGRLFQQRL